MVKAKRVFELLQHLGLSQYEAQVFFELYKQSPQNATSLAQSSKVPRGRIYDVLRSLSSDGLILERPIGGSPTLYEYPAWHNGLERLHQKREVRLQEEQKLVATSYNELIEMFSSVSREVDEEAVLGERQRLVPVSGAIAQDYYIKKILEGAQEKVLTNFTAELLLKYKANLLELKKRKIPRTFLLFETELPQVTDIVKGAKVYMLSEKFLDSPLISAFKDQRPSMIVVDEKVSVLVLLGHSQDALLIRNPELMRYQMFILNLFMQSAEQREV